MKRLSILILLISFNVFSAMSQNVGKVEYFVKVDTLKLGINHATLVFKENASKFTSQVGFNNKLIIEIIDTLKSVSFGVMKFTSINSMNYACYTKKDENILVSVEPSEWKPYFIKERTGNIDWIISSESKYIKEYRCIKATCQFKGRDYEAWFTPDIPVPFGPWKLNGLSGLILQAQDKEGLVQFIFKAYEPSVDSLEVTFPKDEEIINRLEFLKIRKEGLKNQAKQDLLKPTWVIQLVNTKEFIEKEE